MGDRTYGALPNGLTPTWRREWKPGTRRDLPRRLVGGGSLPREVRRHHQGVLPRRRVNSRAAFVYTPSHSVLDLT
jgi:hypothetical protein